jgi:DNA-binding NarL/FixJ family response regulator
VEVPFHREGLQRLLSQDGGMSVIGAVHGEEALAAVEREQPSLVLLDISPTEARRWLGQLRGLAHPPLIVAPAVDETRESILGWIEAGVSGYETTNFILRADSGAAHGCAWRAVLLAARHVDGDSAPLDIGGEPARRLGAAG